MKRTDIHRPSVIVPDDYQFVAFEHIKIEGFGDCEVVLENRRRIQEHMKVTGGFYSQHEHGGNCNVCGASCVYTVLFYHPKSNTYIRTGNDCADKMGMSYGDFSQFKTALKDYTELRTGKRKAQGILAEAGHQEAWAIYLAPFDQSQRDEFTIKDIVGRLVRYGSISEKSMNFVEILLDRIKRRPEILAARAAEREAAALCPNGRVQVSGVVVSVKDQYSDFGVTTKMTVKDDSGFMVWVTVPSSFDVVRGGRVTFKATITPSEKDPKFGFGKRPVIIPEPKQVAIETVMSA